MTDTNDFEAWAIIEVMGHRSYAGRVSERRIAGSGFIQIEIPEGDGFSCKMLGPSSIFAFHLVTEEIARAYAGRPRTEAAVDVFARLGRASAYSLGAADDEGDEGDEFY